MFTKLNQRLASLLITFCLGVFLVGLPNLSLAAAPYDGGAGDGWVMSADLTIILGYGMGSADNQTFNLSGAAVAMSPLTFLFDDVYIPTTANSLRVIIPAGISATWDTTVTTASISGAAAAKFGANVTYGNGNKTATIPVTQVVVAADSIVLSGLKFTGFNALSLNYYYLGADLNNDSVVDITDSQYLFVARSGGAADVYQGGSNDGWAWLSYNEGWIGAITRLKGSTTLRGNVRLK